MSGLLSTDGPARDRAARVQLAVVGEDADFLVRRRVQRFAQRLRLCELILRERLGRKEIQRPAGRVLQDRAENGRVVAGVLRCRRRRDDNVATRARVMASP